MAVVIVMLRQPYSDNPFEMRTDPFWEFGSFGCTGCHERNLMNPKKLHLLNGHRLAFAQNGHLGFKLVHLTPPVRAVTHPHVGELVWTPADMPLTYDNAPILVNRHGYSDFPLLLRMIAGVRRSTPVAQFASKFRSRRRPLPDEAGDELIAGYDAHRATKGRVAEIYTQALPYDPPLVDRDREKTYNDLCRRPLE